MQLDIYLSKSKIGKLFFDTESKKFNLYYLDSWRKHGFALSPYLPLNAEIKREAIDNFLRNLLPEGENLDAISLYKQISKYNTFALIKEIGSDISGAVSFVPKGIETGSGTEFIKIDEDELYRKVKQLNFENLYVWNKKIRLSIAGVGKKLPVLIINGEIGFGEGDLASTHILKFDKDSLHLVENEYLSLFLAKKAGLDVNEASIKQIKDIKILLVERFDRELKNSKVERKHIIDGVQMMNMPPDFKYQRVYGKDSAVTGATVRKLSKIIEKFSTNLIADKNKLIQWILFNTVIGNSDAHVKNISFFVDKRKLEIAPFYDILNIGLYKEFYDSSFALAIGDKFDFEKLEYSDFIDLAADLNIKSNFLLSSLEKMVQKVKKALLKLPKRGVDSDFRKKYIADIEKRLEVIEKILN